MKVSIIGSGVYGKSMGKLMISKDNEVMMWTEQKDFTKVDAHKDIRLTNSFKDIASFGDVIFILTSGKFVKSILTSLKGYVTKEHLIVLGSKSILEDGSLMTDLCGSILPDNRYGVISGPTFAKDIDALHPVGFTLATSTLDDFDLIKSILKDTYLEYSSDLIAIEMAGSLKNVYAIGSGIIEGLNIGHSTKCLYVALALKEIENIFASLGLDSSSTTTLATLGDLILTCTSRDSRNYTFGTMLATKTKREYTEYLNSTTVEGYDNLIAYKKLFTEKKIDAPLLYSIEKIISGSSSTSSLLDKLKN